MHTIERQKEQLSVAGISVTPTPSLNWQVRYRSFSLSDNFVLILHRGGSARAKKMASL